MSGGFLADICGRDTLPDHSLFVAQISQADGGFSLLFPSQRAAPDFVLTMLRLIRFAVQGISFHRDLEAYTFHPTIDALYPSATNPTSNIMRTFDNLLGSISDIATSKRCPSVEKKDNLRFGTHPSTVCVVAYSNTAAARAGQPCTTCSSHKRPTHLLG